MSGPAHHHDAELAVIGAGVAGMAASLFSSEQGLSTVQVSNAGGLLYASGLLDLMAVHPVASQRVWDDPWAAIAAVTRDLPDHPYAKLSRDDIEGAFRHFLAALDEAGLPYEPPGERNREVLTSLGTTKRSYAVPRSMFAGVQALRDRPPGLIVEFRGLRELSARQVVEALRTRWPALRALRLTFPHTDHAAEVYAVHVARALELAEDRKALAALIRPHLGDAEVVGLPAVLGIHRTEAIRAHLEELLGVRVFEIPTMPTSVPGMRLKEALEVALSRRGVSRIVHGNVEEAIVREGGFDLRVGVGADAEHIRARGVVLATGRFTGRGLVACRTGIREAIFGLPVAQPASRADWHRPHFLDATGHGVNLAGLTVDDSFRPLREDGTPAADTLYAVGSILAHQDWVRMKCGSGLAIATAYAAVRRFAASRAEKS